MASLEVAGALGFSWDRVRHWPWVTIPAGVPQQRLFDREQSVGPQRLLNAPHTMTHTNTLLITKTTHHLNPRSSQKPHIIMLRNILMHRCNIVLTIIIIFIYVL